MKRRANSPNPSSDAPGRRRPRPSGPAAPPSAPRGGGPGSGGPHARKRARSAPRRLSRGPRSELSPRPRAASRRDRPEVRVPEPRPDGLERLQKVLAARGVASRRAAERLIVEGRVLVDGIAVRELGTRVAEDARIEVDGSVVPPASRRRYFALNKPVGVVSTVSDPQGRRTVRDVVREEGRLYPVGRLDADSSGLLLLTDDGAWAQRVLHPRYAQPREYEVRVRGRITEERLKRLRGGVTLDEGISRLRDVRVLRRSERESVLRVVLTQGWKRQVRRSLAAVGLAVTSLVRVRIGPLPLGTLAPGAYRPLTRSEIRALAGEG